MHSFTKRKKERKKERKKKHTLRIFVIVRFSCPSGSQGTLLYCVLPNQIQPGSSMEDIIGGVTGAGIDRFLTVRYNSPAGEFSRTSQIFTTLVLSSQARPADLIMYPNSSCNAKNLQWELSLLQNNFRLVLPNLTVHSNGCWTVSGKGRRPPLSWLGCGLGRKF